MENYHCAKTDGLGAVGHGKLVDAAMMRHATNVLRRDPNTEAPSRTPPEGRHEP